MFYAIENSHYSVFNIAFVRFHGGSDCDCYLLTVYKLFTCADKSRDHCCGG